MNKKYILTFLVFSLLFIGISENVHALSLKDFISFSIFQEKYNPEKNVCKSYATRSGTELKGITDYKDIFDILFNEGLVKCNDYRMKTPCEMGNQTWTNNPSISNKDTFKFEAGRNLFEMEDGSICREMSPRELKIEFCSDL